MKARVAAYKLLVQIARADGGLGREELVELQHYHDALDIDPEELLRETLTPETLRIIEGGKTEREQAVRAMARVAIADGRLSRRERRRLHHVARELGVRGIELANILREEHRARTLRPVGFARRSSVKWVLLAVLVAVGWNAVRSTPAEASPALRLQALAEDLDGALVLVETYYEFAHETREPISRTTHGSSFFVSAGGEIVTNKHVVQPWKFQADALRLQQEGYELDTGSIRYTAWRCGATMEDLGAASRGQWSTVAATLGLDRAAPDRWVKATRTCRDGTRLRGTYHGLGSGDLAVLRATVTAPVPFIPLAATSDGVRVLDPVVVLGFPKGPAVFERHHVISTPSLGEVGKVENSLTIHAPMDGGNSGGPIVSLDGKVIGVAARKFPGREGLARCIRAEEVHELLGGD